VLAVMTRSGVLEPLEADQVDPSALIASAGWTDVWTAEAPASVDASRRITFVDDFRQLLTGLGFEESSDASPPGYL
jgi:hypothetical protein